MLKALEQDVLSNPPAPAGAIRRTAVRVVSGLHVYISMAAQMSYRTLMSGLVIHFRPVSASNNHTPTLGHVTPSSVRL